MSTAAVIDPAAAIAAALDALEVRPATSHSWMGRAEPVPEIVVRLADADGIRRALVGGIRARLYESFFILGAPRPAVGAARPATHGERTLSHALSAANEGTGFLEPGWRVVAEEHDGRRVVERGGLRLWVTPGETGGGDPPRTGDVVALRRPTDLPALSPGFYIAHGERGFPAGRPRVLDRVYLDLRPEGAEPFIRETTRRLNDDGLAFIAKVVDEPGGFDRRDAAVLYFDRDDRDRALRAVEDLVRPLEPFLDSGAPAMTLPLAPGVAFAEDPSGSESFGSHRCLLIAEAAVSAAERGLSGLDDRLEAVRERFARAGITLDAPYLGPPAREAAPTGPAGAAVGA